MKPSTAPRARFVATPTRHNAYPVGVVSGGENCKLSGVAGFAGLYYAVTILVDSAYRDQFVDTLGEQLRDTFERRSEYLDLLRRRGVAVAPEEPT